MTVTRGTAPVQFSCLNSATPLELWWSVHWVHLSGSSGWQNTFRQHSSTAGECDLICDDGETQNCTWAWLTLHSETLTLGATVRSQCNTIPLMGNARLLVPFALKALLSVQDSFLWDMHVSVVDALHSALAHCLSCCRCKSMTLCHSWTTATWNLLDSGLLITAWKKQTKKLCNNLLEYHKGEQTADYSLREKKKKSENSWLPVH